MPRKPAGQLELFFTDEATAGLTKKEAYEKLTKEIAFTWLNRIVAFAMMERRGIIHHDAIGKGVESNGFKRWLATPDRSDRLALFNKGDLPKNVYGEGPRDQVYREFLIWQCGDIARELAVLFDTSTLVSRIFPRPRVLHNILEKVNDAEMQPAWEVGNEETIGWIYQYFNENEKAEVFDRLYKKKQKDPASGYSRCNLPLHTSLDCKISRSEHPRQAMDADASRLITYNIARLFGSTKRRNPSRLSQTRPGDYAP